MSTHTLTDRGFKHYAPISTTYGHAISVYESSAASSPHLWLAVELTEAQAGAAHSNIEPCHATAHLSLTQAAELIETLGAAIARHYQLDSA